MLFRSLIAVALAVLAAAPSWAEDAPTASYETVFEMPNVQALAFDETRAKMFVLADNRLWHWTLDPFKLAGSIVTDTLASEMSVTASGTVYAVGQRWDREEFQLLGGSIVGFKPAAEDGPFAAFSAFPREDDADLDGNLIAQFSSVAFDADGRVLAASPVDFLVTVIPDGPGDVVTEFKKELLRLDCGASEQFTVTRLAGADYYISSTVDGPMLEFGRASTSSDVDDEPQCLLVPQPTRGRGKLVALTPVRHAVISEAGEMSAVLVLDPNFGLLHHARVVMRGGVPTLDLANSERIELADLAPSGSAVTSFTHLAATQDGSEIMVSGATADYVLRLGLLDGKLVERGTYRTDAPVRRVVLGPQGRYGAIVTGERFSGGDQRIWVIYNPAAADETARLPRAFDLVLSIQRGLNAAGFWAGTPDGIFGPNTSNAVATYVAATEGKADDQIDPDLHGLVTTGFPAIID